MHTSIASQIDQQSVWEAIGILRQLAFTGEMTVDGEPVVRVYFDNGAVYLVEREGQPAVHVRLVADGAVSSDQVNRGSVTLGGQVNLGRMFDRDASIDRDLVQLAMSNSNDLVLASVSSRLVGQHNLTPFQHHPSGIHHWSRPTTVAIPPLELDVPQLDDMWAADEPSVVTVAHVAVDFPAPVLPAALAEFPPPTVDEAAEDDSPAIWNLIDSLTVQPTSADTTTNVTAAPKRGWLRRSS